MRNNHAMLRGMFANHVTNPSTQTNVAISISANDPTPDEAGTVIYTITATNTYSNPVSGVVVTDDAPAVWAGSGSYSSHVASAGTYVSGTGVWTIGAIAGSASVTLTLTYAIDDMTSGTTVTVTATKTAMVETDDNPADDSDTSQITVAAVQPVASFSASPSGFAVAFTDTSQHSITTWTWNFYSLDDAVDAGLDAAGGLNRLWTSTAQNPSYTYQTVGNHLVTLTVTGPGGTHYVQQWVTVAETWQTLINKHPPAVSHDWAEASGNFANKGLYDLNAAAVPGGTYSRISTGWTQLGNAISIDAADGRARIAGANLARFAADADASNGTDPNVLWVIPVIMDALGHAGGTFTRLWEVNTSTTQTRINWGSTLSSIQVVIKQATTNANYTFPVNYTAGHKLLLVIHYNAATNVVKCIRIEETVDTKPTLLTPSASTAGAGARSAWSGLDMTWGNNSFNSAGIDGKIYQPAIFYGSVPTDDNVLLFLAERFGIQAGLIDGTVEPTANHDYLTATTNAELTTAYATAETNAAAGKFTKIRITAAGNYTALLGNQDSAGAGMIVVEGTVPGVVFYGGEDFSSGVKTWTVNTPNWYATWTYNLTKTSTTRHAGIGGPTYNEIMTLPFVGRVNGKDKLYYYLSLTELNAAAEGNGFYIDDTTNDRVYVNFDPTSVTKIEFGVLNQYVTAVNYAGGLGIIGGYFDLFAKTCDEEGIVDLGTGSQTTIPNQLLIWNTTFRHSANGAWRGIEVHHINVGDVNALSCGEIDTFLNKYDNRNSVGTIHRINGGWRMYDATIRDDSENETFFYGDNKIQESLYSGFRKWVAWHCTTDLRMDWAWQDIVFDTVNLLYGRLVSVYLEKGYIFSIRRGEIGYTSLHSNFLYGAILGSATYQLTLGLSATDRLNIHDVQTNSKSGQAGNSYLLHVNDTSQTAMAAWNNDQGGYNVPASANQDYIIQECDWKINTPADSNRKLMYNANSANLATWNVMVNNACRDISQASSFRNGSLTSTLAVWEAVIVGGTVSGNTMATT